MIYNSEKPILNTDSFSVSKDSIEQLFELNTLILNYHFENKNIHATAYKNNFENIMRTNLCNQTVVNLKLIPYDCSNFISSSATHVNLCIIV